jgi:hypothetical protein
MLSGTSALARHHRLWRWAVGLCGCNSNTGRKMSGLSDVPTAKAVSREFLRGKDISTLSVLNFTDVSGVCISPLLHSRVLIWLSLYSFNRMVLDWGAGDELLGRRTTSC